MSDPLFVFAPSPSFPSYLDPLSVINSARTKTPYFPNFGVGGKILIDFSFGQANYDKRIFISLGTVMNQNAVFYRECIKAFTGQPYEVVMAVGNKVAIEDLGELPPNLHVKKYVPQLEVLKLSDLFLSHGGMNSVNESLYFGVPLLLFPQQAEQLVVARRVESLGAGLCMHTGMKMDAEEIIQAVHRMLSHHEYSLQAKKIGATLRDAGGYKAAAGYILRNKA